jgi:hypothetical protein
MLCAYIYILVYGYDETYNISVFKELQLSWHYFESDGGLSFKVINDNTCRLKVYTQC